MKLSLTLIISMLALSSFAQDRIQLSHSLNAAVQSGYNPGNGFLATGIWDKEDETLGASLQYNRFNAINTDAATPDVNTIAATFVGFVKIKNNWNVRFDYGVSVIDDGGWSFDAPSSIAVSHMPKKSAISFEFGFTQYTLSGFHYGFLRMGITILP